MSSSLLFEKVDNAAISDNLPFRIRPIAAEDCKIPFVVETVAGLNLRKYGKVTASEASILSAFRFKNVKESTDLQVEFAELYQEMSINLDVHTMSELNDLMLDPVKLKELEEKKQIDQEMVQSWADGWLELNRKVVLSYNTKTVLELDLITFVIAMRGDNPDWDYEDTYGVLSQEEQLQVLEFLYAEEGVDPSPEPEKKLS